MRQYIRTIFQNNDLGYIAIFLYISFLNIFVLRVSMELIALQFLLLIFFFKRSKSSKFAKDWIPYIALFFIYEFLRGYADDFSPFYDTVLYWVHLTEDAIFPELPTIFLQRFFDHHLGSVYILFLFYTSFFYFSHVIAFLIWNYRYELFHTYFRQYIIVAFVGLLFYFLIPTAPPWMASEEFSLGIKRYFYDIIVSESNRSGTLMYYFVTGNAVAAYPSLHTAWSAFSALFVVRHFGRKYAWTLIVPIMISLAIVVGGEHYVIDVLAGWFLAWYVARSEGKMLQT